MSNGTEAKGPDPPSTVTYGDKEYEIVREGSTEILNIKNTDPQPKQFANSQTVFYNPIQQFNRDLSVLAIRAFGEDFAVVRRLRHEKRSLKDGSQQRGKKRKRGPESGQEPNGMIEPPAIDATDSAGTNPPNANPQHHSSVAKDASTSEKKEVHGTNHPELELAPKAPKAQLDRENRPPPKPSFRILDALSATGLRALRYAKELPMVTSVTANDLSSAASTSIALNVKHNGVSDIVKPVTSDARVHMYNSASSNLPADQRLYHVIDLDPYGTAAPFLDAAVQALSDGGLLCVTCTDAGVFASTGYLEKTCSQYGGLPFKGVQSHEGGLRLILHAVAASAARYGIAIEPLLSLSIDFYARLFIRVKRSPAEVKLLAGKTMIVYNCDGGCGAWTTQFLARSSEKKAKNGDPIYKFSLAQAPSATPHCEHCGFITHLSGPMWGGPLHNPFYVQKILDLLPSLDTKVYGTIPRIEGMLTVARDEALLDEPCIITESASSAADKPNTESTPTEAETPSSPPENTTANKPPQTDIQSSEKPFPSLPPSTRANHPFFLIPSHLARVIHCTSPSDAAFRGALIHLGYRTSRSHTKPGSIVTDAPFGVVWEIMREYARQKVPMKEGSVKPGTAGWGIMAKSRANHPLNAAKAALTQIAEGKANSIEDLKTEVEALLYRLSKPESADGEEDNENSEAGNDDAKAENGDAGKGDRRVPDGDEKADGEKAIKSDGKAEKGIHTLSIKFDENLGREKPGKKIVRYQENPRAEWGPMRKAGGGL